MVENVTSVAGVERMRQRLEDIEKNRVREAGSILSQKPHVAAGASFLFQVANASSAEGNQVEIHALP